MDGSFKMKRAIIRGSAACLCVLQWLFLGDSHLAADGAADNKDGNVRRIPPAGIEVPEEVRADLAERTKRLGEALETLRTEVASKTALAERWADAAIFQKAVDWALRYGEFFRKDEFVEASQQLELGEQRVASLRAGQVPWNDATGPLVRAYVSRIDGSVQPYGLVVPASYRPRDGRRHRLDFWFHGRGEQLSELAFIRDRRRSLGEFAPADAFVLHLYGRYCNGSRFAGETDFWEALADVKKQYPIDEDRMVVRGFSLGGAACWHITTHYASRWAASAPGAGFSETADFLRVFQEETLRPSAWEQKLWRLYDSTSIALNTANTSVVAYSGEVDRQKQAADAMEKAMAAEGLALTHLIGPKTAHAYEPGAKVELNRRIDALANRGRDKSPQTVKFSTYSLRYNRMAWVQVDALDEHWAEGRVIARQDPGRNSLAVDAQGVSALSLLFESGEAGFELGKPVSVTVNGTILKGPVAASDRSWGFSAWCQGSNWLAGRLPSDRPRKAHGLQGPIDDAFMDSFVMVMPTGKPLNEATGRWVREESERAVQQWRRQFRGDARVKSDHAVTEQDWAGANLVLWGDPSSNDLIARILGDLPIQWTADAVRVNGREYQADKVVPILIFPNPLNPQRYVVINSGFTFRDYDYLNNARQTPKLPDWAVIDLTERPGSRRPGRIADAGFFNEQWAWK